ncbi:MAG TPA: xanthine dehydrogenase family protein subunit M [Longimicrobiales bacterium]|nr:xanthine dehydrogenase family protein subunit M [Longimicrobiales bacterium]
MHPSRFEYHRAGSVEEALELLSTHGEEAKLLAGGHSLLPLMKLRFAEPAHLIDIRHVEGLSGIREEDGTVVIGATTTHREVESSPLLREKVPILAEAASLIGDPLVRNMGTIGGSLAHADPAADLPAVVLALDAEIRAVGPDGSRTIPAEDCFLGIFTSALTAAEVLTEVRVPVPGAGTGQAYEKFPHPASRYALAGVAASVSVDGGTIEGARVAVTGLGGVASRARGVEEALTGSPAEAATVEEAAARSDEGLDPQADLQGSVEYKRNLARVVARRALARALERAGS